MKHARIDLARSAALLPPLTGPIGVFGDIEPSRLSGLEGLTLFCESRSFTASTALSRANIHVDHTLGAAITDAIVFLPRAKAEALDLIARAIEAAPEGWLIVDGQKTDGIDSIAKQIARDVTVNGTYVKGHGKTLWFQAAQAGALRKWRRGPLEIEGGFLTAPGVFSADAVDPASAFLLEHIPHDLKGSVVDLGAGWGYLSVGLFKHAPGIKTVHLVEDNARALECAKSNANDPRAQFHWGDALTWSAPEAIQTIIMNPPFHKSRNAEPSLGIAFIEAAARILKPGGKLYMVANAHLPYEAALAQNFTKTEIIARTNRFKVFCAERGRAKMRL